MAKFGIGQSVKRVEDFRLLTGQGMYTDDVAAEGGPGIHPSLALCPRQDQVGRHVGGQRHAGRASGADRRGYRGGRHRPQSLPPVKNRDGTDRANTPRPVIETDTVRHVGVPVAVVVAETTEQARDAAEAIEVDYEPLGSTVDAEKATLDGAPQLYDHIANNVAFDWESGDKDGVDAALAGAAKVVDVVIHSSRSS